MNNLKSSAVERVLPFPWQLGTLFVIHRSKHSTWQPVAGAKFILSSYILHQMQDCLPSLFWNRRVALFFSALEYSKICGWKMLILFLLRPVRKGSESFSWMWSHLFASGRYFFKQRKKWENFLKVKTMGSF